MRTRPRNNRKATQARATKTRPKNDSAYAGPGVQPISRNVPEQLTIFLTDPHMRGGGQVRYLTNLSRELVGMGHDVTIGCRPGSILVEKAREAGCGVVPEFPFRGGARPRSWIEDMRRVRAVLEAKQPDIVHTNLSQDHWACAVTNRLMGRPYCVVRTRHNTFRVRDSFPNRVLNRRWTDYQIVVCETVRERLASQPTFIEERMCSIHNGVDAGQYRPNPEIRARMRREFGFEGGDLVLGIAARLVEDKGHQFLFRALAEVLNQFPNLHVLVLGEGPLEDALRAMAENLSISDHVIFAGYRDDMAECVQAFDIGVQPSIGVDTSSFSLKEQMACEKPVIASDYGGLTEIVTDGVEGFVVPAGTVEPLAEAIRRLAADQSLQEQMGAAGRQRVLREFTIEVFAQRTVDAYRRALEFHGANVGTG